MLIFVKSPYLADNIRFLRERKKMSRASFAAYLNVNYNRIFCLERHINRYIHTEMLDTLSQIYGITTEEILWEDLRSKFKGKRCQYKKDAH